MKHRLFNVILITCVCSLSVSAIIVFLQAYSLVSLPSFRAHSGESSQGITGKSFSIKEAFIIRTNPLIRVESGRIEFHTEKKLDQKTSMFSGLLPDYWINLIISQSIRSISLSDAEISIDVRAYQPLSIKKKTLGLLLKKSALSFIHIKDSKVIFKRETAKPYTAEINEAKFQLDTEDLEVEGAGELKFLNEQRAFSLVAKDKGIDAKGVSHTKLNLTIKSDNLSADYSGTFNGRKGLSLIGNLQLDVNQPNTLFSNIKYDDLSEQNRLQIAGTLNWSVEDGGILTDGEFSFLGNRATGSLGLALGKNFPQLSGTLAFEELDLETVFQAEQLQNPRKHINEQDDTNFGDQLVALVHSQLGVIKEIDADLRLSAKQIKFGPFDLEESAFSLFQKDGTVIFDMAESRLFDGQATGHIKIDTNFPKPRWHINTSIRDVDIVRLSGLLSKSTPLEGKGNLTLHLTSFGDKSEELYQNMFGNLELAMSKGGDVKLDFNRIAQAKPRMDVEGWEQIAGIKNEFESLFAKGRFSKGAIITDQFEIRTDKYKLVGLGKVDLKNNTLDWQIAAMARRSAPKDKTTDMASHLLSPLSCSKIDGPFNAPFIMSVGGDNMKTAKQVCPALSEIKILEQNLRDVVRSGNSG